MKTVALLVLFLFVFAQTLFGLNSLKLIVRSRDDNQALSGANVYFDSLQIGASTNATGMAMIKGIPNGKHMLIISYVGYQIQKLSLTFPLKKTKQPFTVLLSPAPFSSDQIVVTSTRNNSIVDQTPVRIEVLGKEEVNEEISIRPGNISKFLGESSSIITRQTSSVSGAVSFRLQGLPGRYTQILKDGFPDFSGFASGFSPLQIPPLDLKQIEITRGSYSTLFANGAVAGIVNLISRRPLVKPQLDLLLNQTHRQGTDISSFYSAKYSQAGLTFLVSQSLQNAVDVDDDGFSDIPQFRQTTVKPRLFYDLNKTTSLMVGLTSFFENRSGGDMQALQRGADSVHVYTEKYASKRLGLNLRFQKQFRDSASLTLKSSYQNFTQNAAFPETYFSGREDFVFAELSYFKPWENHKWVSGASLISHSFTQKKKSFSALYDLRSTTFGLFAQDDWNFAPNWTAHAGLRWDYRNGSQSFLLPHAALLFNSGKNIKLRFSGGLGYSIPALFDVAPRHEYFAYRVRASFKTQSERSRDMAFDATYRFATRELAFSLNQAFYTTQIDRALFAFPNTNHTPVSFFSAPLTARGAETHLLFNLDELELFVDYNYAVVRRSLTAKREILPFTPKQKLDITVTYEQEGNWRTGLEGFYTGRQFLEDGSKGRDYFIFGIMFEKKLGKFSLILNVENVLDERQSKYEKMVRGPESRPDFKDIYMPIDGRVANLVLWLKL